MRTESTLETWNLPCSSFGRYCWTRNCTRRVRNMMQANAELMNNMIDLMQAGKCPHRPLAASLPRLTVTEVRQVEMAACLMGAAPGAGIPDRDFISRLRQQVVDECSKLERG